MAAASNSDKFKKLTNNFSTTLSAPIVGSSDTSMSLASTTNLPTDTGVVFVIDRVNATGTATPSSREYVKGTVSGSNVINLVRGVGNSTAQAHSTGAVVEQVVDQTTINDLMDGILAQHNQDGTHGAVTATSVASSGTVSGTTGVFSSDVSDNSVTLKTVRSETAFDFVASGCVWTADAAGSTKAASMTAGVVYIGGKRVVVSAVTSRTFTASKDTYVDVDNTGTITYTEVTNNAASPALAANSIRLAIIVTGASNIANSGSINQGQETAVLPIVSSIPYAVTDSLGNLICPRDPNRKILGYRQITAAVGPLGTSLTDVDITGMSVPFIAPGNRKVKVTLQGSDYEQTGGIGTVYAVVRVREGSTRIANYCVVPSAANFPNGFCATKSVTPSAGLHTYKMSVNNNATGPNFTIGAASDDPCCLMVELV